MPPADIIFKPRRHRVPASDALLSAALGGLLCLTTSCGPGGDAVAPDAGPGSDLGPAVDAGSDAGAPSDAGSDAGTPFDAGTPVDAGPSMDAGAMDAATPADGAGPVDAGPRDAPCDVDPLRMITAADAAPGLTLAEFTAMCDGLGGFIEIHPHCGGMNSCRGISYDSGIGVLTEHTCAGLNTCTGFSCVVP